MPGKTAESIAFWRSLRHRMIAPHAPRSVFCVVVVDDVRVRDRRRVLAAGDQARDVRHVDEERRADRVRDLAHPRPVDDARVGREAADDHLRPHLLGQLLHGVVVDQLGLAIDAVRVDLVELAAEVRGAAVREVAAGRQVHAHHPVAGLAHRHVDGRVGLRAGVRLHVHVLGAEQLLGALDGERLDLVDHLAGAAVVAPAGIALGVLVGEQRAERLEDRRAGQVLGRDQLERLGLALVLLADQVGDVGIDPVEGPKGHRGDWAWPSS